MLFHTGFPKSIWLLLRSNPPLHKCFLRAKGYHCNFCELLPAVFLWKTFFFKLLSLAHSLLLHHITCFLPFAPCAAQRWERSGHWKSWFVRWVTLWQLPSQGMAWEWGQQTLSSSQGATQSFARALSIAWPSSASVNLSLINGHEDDLGSGPRSLWKCIPHLFWHLSHPAS